MRCMHLVVVNAVVAVACAFAQAAEPVRDAGLSAHFLPARVGQLRGEPGGFDVRPHGAVKDRRLFPSAEALIVFFKTLPRTVQDNGIWVVMTHPAAYEDAELKQLSVLEDLCKRNKAPLFVARASELPNGWRRKI